MKNAMNHVPSPEQRRIQSLRESRKSQNSKNSNTSQRKSVSSFDRQFKNPRTGKYRIPTHYQTNPMLTNVKYDIQNGKREDPFVYNTISPLLRENRIEINNKGQPKIINPNDNKGLLYKLFALNPLRRRGGTMKQKRKNGSTTRRKR